jgi:hypothetical protein
MKSIILIFGSHKRKVNLVAGQRSGVGSGFEYRSESM